MSKHDKKDGPPLRRDKPGKGATDRAARQAETLRANLQRRKAQSRARRAESPDEKDAG